MRPCHLLVLIVALCIMVECGGTNVTRVVRTVPFDLSPTSWAARLRSLWPGGTFWNWPRSTGESLWRLITAPDTRKKMIFEFRPEDGPRASYAYQSRYGYRGQWLIDWLGSGFHPNGVPYRQPEPAFVLVPPPSPF